jgi:hypothetical protein
MQAGMRRLSVEFAKRAYLAAPEAKDASGSGK